MRCGICNVGNIDRRAGDSPRRKFYSVCSVCGHWLRDAPEDLYKWHAERYRFEQKYNKAETTKDGKITPAFHAARREMCLNRMEYIAPYLPEIKTAFDIGCGAGTFLAMLRDRVPTVSGIEVHSELVAACAEQGIECTLGNFMTWTPTTCYDAVFAWHVLEHVREAYEFVVKALSMTTKYLILEIPYRRGIDRKFSGHVHLFRHGSFKALLERTGRPILELREGIQTPALFAVLGAANA